MGWFIYMLKCCLKSILKVFDAFFEKNNYLNAMPKYETENKRLNFSYLCSSAAFCAILKCQQNQNNGKQQFGFKEYDEKDLSQY